MAQDNAQVNAVLHDDEYTNFSSNPHLTDLLATGVTRRQALQGGASAALLSALGYAGCATANYNVKPGQAGKKLKLGFDAVPKSLADTVVVPPGYSARALYALGDPIDLATADWAGDGSETGASYEHRAGDHHDGMSFFGMNRGGHPNKNGADRGLLCMNHEALTTNYLHPAGATTVAGVRTVLDEVIKEINAHGVSVIEIAKDGAGDFQVERGSGNNRRITAATPMELGGPVAGSDFAKTKYSTDGTMTRGTVNNCANGYTPWGTYLTCEENWAGYFRRGDDAAARSAAENTSLSRYGRGPNTTGRHRWDTAGAADDYKRWDITVTGASATDDFRNAINTFGYIVEIDPFDPTSTPKKRTALGRMGHEGCWPARSTPGKPVVFYMGDDSRGEYIYKFVSDALYDPEDKGLAAGDKYMDAGKLYAAKFNADGSGEWIELSYGVNGLDGGNATYPFASQADVVLNARLAADAVGATRMDRPEWGAVSPVNGEVYMTLTNNSRRGSTFALDAANPRSYDSGTDANADLDGNVNGHVIRWHEAGGNPAALAFNWDIFLFASRASYGAGVNLSALGSDNDMSSPDGLWFDPRGLLWIQTDDGAYTDTTNCMMLAAIPGAVGDGGPAVTSNGIVTPKGVNPSADTLRRFLVGPTECEITGVAMTPDGRAMFVNIQHPGEDGTHDAPSSNWPDGGDTRPRSATVVITRDDGGVVGL